MSIWLSIYVNKLNYRIRKLFFILRRDLKHLFIFLFREEGLVRECSTCNRGSTSCSCKCKWYRIDATSRCRTWCCAFCWRWHGYEYSHIITYTFWSASWKHWWGSSTCVGYFPSSCSSKSEFSSASLSNFKIYFYLGTYPRVKQYQEKKIIR